MIKARGGFRFPSKALEMRFLRPMAQANYFESNSAVQTFLPRAIHHALATATDYLQQFVITEVAECFCAIEFLVSIRCYRTIIVAGVIRLRRGYGGQADPGYSFASQQIKAGLKQASSTETF